MSECAGCGQGFETDQLLMQHWMKEGLYKKGKSLRFTPEKPHSKMQTGSQGTEDVPVMVPEYIQKYSGGFRIPTKLIWILGIVAWFVVLSFDCAT